MNRPSLNPDTDALCTVVHACGYQVGRASRTYEYNKGAPFGHPTWSPRNARNLYPRGRHADPERMLATLHLMGVEFDIPYSLGLYRPVYRMLS